MNRKLKLSLLGTLIVGSTLANALPIISCSSSTSDIELIVEDSVMENVVYSVTESLINKMQAPDITNSQQVELAAKWSIGSEIEKEELNIISNQLKFMDGDKEVSYDEAVKSVTFNSKTTIGKFETNINGPELKINFKEGYTGNILIKINSLGLAAINKLTVSQNIINNIKDLVTTSLTNLMQDNISSESQKELAAEWSVGTMIPSSELDIFKQNLVFENSDIKYEDAVESVTFDSDTIIGQLNDSIQGPKLKVNFKKGYTGDISIQIDSLGNVLPSKLLSYDENDVITITNESTNFVKNLMISFSQNRERQILFSNIYYTKGTKYFASDSNVGEIITKLNFIDGDGNTISSDQAIIFVEVIEGVTIPNPGQPIMGPIFKIELKNDYFLNEVLVIETGTIGTAW